MHLPIIWIEIIPLLQVYFSHFIAKQGAIFKDKYLQGAIFKDKYLQGAIFKDICFKQGTQFCSAFSSSGLIYFGPVKLKFTRAEAINSGEIL